MKRQKPVRDNDSVAMTTNERIVNKWIHRYVLVEKIFRVIEVKLYKLYMLTFNFKCNAEEKKTWT